MTTAMLTGGEDKALQKYLYFTLDCLNCVDLFSVLIVIKTCSPKHKMTAFNSKGRHEKLVMVVNFLQNTNDFVISRHCFA